MLSSVLPGLRELRTPLSAGYLWLANVWLLLGGPLPKARPAKGLLSSVWTLGSYAGKPGLAVVLSFVAYMVGSFVEINPLRLWEHGGRPKWINQLRGLIRRNPALRVFRVWPVSKQAEGDLISFSKDDLGFAGTHESDNTSLMRQIMLEEGQIATRLQATNTELFGKYDRLLAESSFRINVSPPLVILVLQLLSVFHLPIFSKLVFSVIAVTYGFVLFRQGVARAIQSRDVILQALIVGVVESRTLTRLRPHSTRPDDATPHDSLGSSKAGEAESSP